MKKVLWLIVCLMTMVVSVNAQDYKDVKYHKIKEAAVEAFKSNLIAPSKFILSDKNGNKISIDDLYVSIEKEKTEIEEVEIGDSVVTFEKYYPLCWVVLVEGDAMNRAGGYGHTSGVVYVNGNENYAYAQYPKGRTYEVKKIKSIYNENNWANQHNLKHTKGIDIPFVFGKFEIPCDLLLFDWIKCPLCRNEWIDLGKDDYEKLVNTRRKCKEYKEYEKKKDQERKQDEEDRKNKKEAKFNKYLNM